MADAPGSTRLLRRSRTDRVIAGVCGGVVPVTGSARTVRARVGVGQLIVELPSDQVAVVQGHAGMGQVTIFGQSDEGFGVDKDVTPSVPEGEPIAFSLELSVGIGEVRVQHG